MSNWMDRAACAGMETDLFFPDHHANAQRNRALKVCSTCPVIKECLEAELEASNYGLNAQVGIRGGMTQTQRASYLRELGINNAHQGLGDNFWRDVGMWRTSNLLRWEDIANIVDRVKGVSMDPAHLKTGYRQWKEKNDA